MQRKCSAAAFLVQFPGGLCKSSADRVQLRCKPLNSARTYGLLLLADAGSPGYCRSRSEPELPVQGRFQLQVLRIAFACLRLVWA
jgi:hypothetical protein